MKKIKETSIAVLSALIIFIIISVAYMYPALQGKNVHQGDIVQHIGMSKEIVDYRNATGDEALWTNSAFGGMPAYLISTKYKSNILRFFHYLFLLNNWRPVGFIFLYMFGFYLAMLAFGINRWLSIVGAIAYAFSSYFFIIIIAGHNAKVLALGYMPAIIAGAYLAFRGKYILGALMMGFFLSLQIYITHIQIAYYTFLIILMLGITELISAIKEKKLKTFSLAVAAMVIAAILAIGSNFSNLWSTYEYGQYSMRGKSELSLDEDNQTSGLDKDYATQWSYGIAETFTLLIPNFQGGPSVSALPEKSKTFEFLKKIQSPKQARQTIKQMPTYWGDQTSTAGPVYVGAILIFLFILSLFVVKSRIKWWLVAVVLLSIMLSWGRNFQFLTHLFLDYFPMYNKFRTVSMILIMAEFAIPLLAMIGLNTILKGEIEKKKLVKYILNSVYITGGICLFFILTAGALFDFKSSYDQQYLAQGATEFVSALQADRLMLLRRDAFRSLVFILLAGGLLWYYSQGKIKKGYLIVGLGLLILVDMWAVDKRYLNKSDFVREKEYKNPIPITKADEFILDHSKSDPDYRVLDLNNPFNNGTTSYYHKSLGGYHGAKMRRYQELIEFHIMPEINGLIGALQSGSLANADSVLNRSGILNMLNTHYILYNPEARPLINRHALGHAWFVSNLKIVTDANEEIIILGQVDPATTAVVDDDFEGMVENFIPGFDSSATISLTSYAPNELHYMTKSSREQLAVFSEIYYPKGWKASLDGEDADYFRADYILRAMMIPPGEHEIVFTFRPASYYTGNKISYASSGLLLLVLLGVVFFEIRKTIRKESD